MIGSIQFSTMSKRRFVESVCVGPSWSARPAIENPAPVCRTRLRRIVQSDVLAFVSRVETDPLLKLIAKKTKMVFPLYNEEIHLVGRRDIASFDGRGWEGVVLDAATRDDLKSQFRTKGGRH